MSDYLVNLLTNRKTYTARINVMKKHPHLFTDADEFEQMMQIERDLAILDFCIEQLEPLPRDIIDQIYKRSISTRQYARARNMSKSVIHNKKLVALRELRAIFRPEG